MDVNGSLIKFSAPTGKDPVCRNIYKMVDVRYQCIAMMKEYENYNQEELRLQYYASKNQKYDANHKTHIRLLTELISLCLNDTLIEFIPTEDVDVTMCHDITKVVHVRYQCISTRKEYENKSPEELRFEHYEHKRHLGVINSKTQISLFGQVSTLPEMPFLQKMLSHSKFSISSLKKYGFIPEDNINIDTESRTSISSCPHHQNLENVERKELCPKTHEQQENDICVICCEGKKTHILISCGHVTCVSCAKKITNQSKSACPFCRKNIKNVIKIHW